ncbi:TonB-dependent receptor [Thalassotalea sp. SU-HH00458]
MLASSALTVSAYEEKSTEEKVNDDIEVIEVQGTRDALAAALDRKRESKNVIDTIIAEDIGKMADENVAEALQRVTGISIQRDMGEGTSVNIRGMGSDFNQIKVNGQTMTSGGNGRDVDFSSFSADLLAAIEVVKTPSASHDEGSIGGSINLKTRRPLDIQKDQLFSAEFKESYSELADEYDPSLAFTYIRNIDNKFGFSGNVSYENRHVRQDQYFTRGWRDFDLALIDDAALSSDTAQESKENIAADKDGIGWYPDEFGQRLDLQERTRLGGTLNLQYRPTEDIDTHIDFTYSELEKEHTFYQNWNRFRFNQGLVENITIDPWGTMLSGDFIGKAARYPDQQHTTRSERQGETTTKTFMVGFGGDYRMDRLTISGEFGYSRSKEDNDKESQYLFAAQNITHGFNVGQDDLIEITQVGSSSIGLYDNPHRLSQIRNNVRHVDDENYSAQIDFDYALDNEFFSAVEFGAKWTDRQKSKEDDSTYIKMWLEDINNADKVRSSFMDPSNPTQLPVDDFMSGQGSNNMIRDWSVIDFDTAQQNALDVFGVNSFDELPFSKYRDFRNSFNLDIETKALYALLAIDALDGRLVGDIGLRYVETTRTSRGYAGNQFNMLEYREGLDNYAKLPVVDYRDVNVVKEYDNLLPSLNLRYALSEDKLIRFAVSEVMARPNFWEIAPYMKSAPLVDRPGLWAGNPHLDPFEATQVDLAFEWYFDKGAMANIGTFYKDISSFYYNKITEGVTHDPVTGDPYWLDGEGEPVGFRAQMPENGAGGDIFGIETSFQTNFTFLPGKWANFGTLVNYTYTDSEADYLKLEAGDESPLQEVDLPFLNQSKHSANATLYYEDKGVNVRLAYTYRTESLYTPAGANGNMYWNDDYGQLDFSAGYSLGKYWLSFNVVNVTDEVQERYVTSPLEGNSLEGDGPSNRMLYMSQAGRIFRLGINGKF